MQALRFSTFVNAPRDRVWALMLAPDTYRTWTAPFMEGSTYQGGWEPGRRIRFLGPDGDGMVSEVVENRRGEFVSVRHLGMVRKDGSEDLDSPEVRAWAGARESYRFLERDGGTEVQVELDITPEHAQFMQDAWPRALAVLKDLCEGRR